jgi:hypothetical protein
MFVFSSISISHSLSAPSRGRFTPVIHRARGAQTVVEVVALKDAAFLISCCFLDECPEVFAGNSLSFRATNATRTCFMATDLSSKLTVSGTIQGGTMEIDSASVCKIYDGPVRLTAQNFQIVKLATDNSEDLELNFGDGNAQFKFARVTNTTGPGVVGVSSMARVKTLSGDPPYPSLEIDPMSYVLLGGIPLSIVLVCTGFVTILSRTVKDADAPGSEETASSLYDEQSVDVEAGDTAIESEKKASSENEDTTDHENPYEKNGELCL